MNVSAGFGQTGLRVSPERYGEAMYKLLMKLFLPTAALILGGIYLCDVLNKSVDAAALIKPVYVLLCIVYIFVCISDIRVWSKEKANMEHKETVLTDALSSNREFRKILVCIGGTAAYILALKYIGFTLSTAIFLFSGFMFTQSKNKLVSALIAVLVTGAILVIFKIVLLVPLPRGFIGI